MTRRATLGIPGLLILACAASLTAAGNEPPANAKREAPARQLAPKAGKWDVPLGPALPQAGNFAKVPLPDMAFRGEHPQGAALAPAAGKAAVFYHDKPMHEATRTKVMLCDLRRGQITQSWWVSSVLYVLDYDAVRGRILARSHSPAVGKKDTLDILTIAADGALMARRWVPYREESEKTRDVLWAGFVGADRVVTLSTGGKLTVWDSSTSKALCWALVFPATPAVSPNGKYVAVLQRDSQVGLLDPAAGQFLGQLPLGVALTEPTLAFRPDGRALACAAKDMVVVLDIPTARVELGIVPGITGKKPESAPSVGWVDDRLLFINDFLVDPAVACPLWRYTGGEWSQPCGDQVVFLTNTGFKEVALVPVQVPAAKVRETIAAGRKAPPTVLLRPSDTVQVDVSQLPKENQQEAKQALEKRLREIGYRPAAQAAVRLEARIAQDDHRNTSYTGGRRETVRSRYVVAGLRLVYEGKEIWNGTKELTSGPGFMVWVRPGESVASQLAGSSIPDYAKLAQVNLPKFLVKGQGSGSDPSPLGSTWVRPDRVR